MLKMPAARRIIEATRKKIPPSLHGSMCARWRLRFLTRGAIFSLERCWSLHILVLSNQHVPIAGRLARCIGPFLAVAEASVQTAVDYVPNLAQAPDVQVIANV